MIEIRFRQTSRGDLEIKEDSCLLWFPGGAAARQYRAEVHSTEENNVGGYWKGLPRNWIGV